MIEDDSKPDEEKAPKAPPGALRPPGIEEIAGDLPRYKVLEILGFGGMGAVYKAEQSSMGRVVAVKVLLDPALIATGSAARFEREAQAMAQLNHPNIVKVYELGETTRGLPYFVMEFVSGGTLRDLVRKGPIDASRAMSIAMQVCDALQYAHLYGVVHRDIKPGNILIDRSGRIKVSDFGLAKIIGLDEAEMTMTRTRGAMGTLGYIAPEQMESGSLIDHRADIYSVGVTLYEMLTGELPRGAFKPPSAFVEGLDTRIDDIVVRAMLAEPDQRYQDVSDVRSSLEFIRDDTSGTLPLPEQRSTTIVTHETTVQEIPRAIPATAASETSAKPWLIGAAALLTLGTAAFFAVGFLSKPDAPEATEALEKFAEITPLAPKPPIPAAEPAPNPVVPKPKPPPPVAVDLKRPERPTTFPLQRTREPGKPVCWLTPAFSGDDIAGTVADVPDGLDDVIALEVDHGWEKVPLPSHAVALRADGTVVAWGENAFGQTNVPEGLADVVAISAGRQHNLALRADGTVVAWGREENDRCKVPDDLEHVVAVAAGNQHNLALKADGSVVAWGSPGEGKTEVPDNLENVVAISAGAWHSLALTADAKVVAWGDDKFRQSSVPAGLRDVVDLLGTENQSFALRSDGTVVAWGKDIPGQSIELPLTALEMRETRVNGGEVFRKSDGAWARFEIGAGKLITIALPMDGMESIARTIECTFAILPAELSAGIASPLLTLPEPAPSGTPMPQYRYLAEEITVAAAPPSGRYIRIELPGATNALTLAEVEVYSRGENLAREGTATQSSVSHGGVPERAIDGNLDGAFSRGGQTHTAEGVDPDRDPWWELDLGNDVPIERILVFNRRGESYHERLEGFTLKILDAARNEVFAHGDNPGQREPLAFLFGEPSPEMLALLKAEADANATAAAARPLALRMAALGPADDLPYAGLVGDYHRGTNLDQFVLRRNDPAINFDWVQDSPGPGVPADGFSVRWTGAVVPKFTETYTFHATTDDGVRLWVEDPAGTPESGALKPLFESGRIGLKTPGHAIGIDVPVSAEAGSLYLVVDRSGNSNAEDHAAWAEPRVVMADGSEIRLTDLEWRSATQTWNEVRKNLGVNGDPLIIDGVPVEDGIGTHADSLIVYDIPGAAVRFVARAGLCAKPEFRWSSVQFFVLNTTDAGFAAWQEEASDTLLIDRWSDHAATEFTASIPLAASRPVRLRMEYYEGAKDAVARLEWSSASQPREVVPFATTDLLTPPPPLAAPPPAASDVLTALPPGESVDLLALVDPARDRVLGEWSFENGVLTGGVPNRQSTLSLSAIPGGSYRITAAFTRIEGENSFGLHLPVKNKEASLFFDHNGASGTDASGLEVLDGMSVMDENNPTRVFPGTLETGRRYTTQVTVRYGEGETASIDVTLDGEPYTSWEGNVSSLECRSQWSLPDPRALGLAVSHSRFQVHEVRFESLEGEANLTRSTQPGPEAGPKKTPIAPSSSLPPGKPLPELVDNFKKLKPGKLEFWPLDEGANPPRAAIIAEMPPGLDDVVAFDIKQRWLDSEKRPSPPYILALRADGTVAAWGYNDAGQCDVPEGLSNVVAISAGGRHGLALTAEGRVVTWGGGNLGDQLRVPSEVKTAVAIAAATAHSLAIRSDGTVVAWGADWGGQLDVPAGLNNVVAIAVGEMRSLALTGDGKVVAWGDNAQWPMTVPDNLRPGIEIAAMTRHEFLLQDGGVLVGWGQAFQGETVRIPEVKRLGAFREIDVLTIQKNDGNWHRLDLSNGPSEPTPMPRVSGCTAVAIEDGFILAIHPDSETDRRLAELEAKFMNLYKERAHRSYLADIVELETKYLKALNGERDAEKRSGDLDAIIMLDNEIARVKNREPNPPEPPEGANPNVVRYFNAFVSQGEDIRRVRAARARPDVVGYKKALTDLEKDLIKSGDTAEAGRVRALLGAIDDEKLWMEIGNQSE